MMSTHEPVIFLAGRRIDLCPLRREDTHLYQKWLNDLDVGGWLTMHQPLTYEQELTLMEERFLRLPITEGVVLGIWLKDQGQLIGNVGIHQIHPRDRHGMLGIFIGDKAYWGKGFAQEACELILEYAFGTLNLRKVWLFHYGHNARGRKLYDRLGFEEIGRYREHAFVEGAWRDHVLMELFRRDFLKKDIT